MEWHYAENGQQRGPVSRQELEELVRAGRLPRTSLVWRQGMTDWQPYASTELAAPPILTDGNTAACVECGQVFSTDDLLHYENSWVCAKCKPIFFQRVKEGAAPPASLMLWRSGRVLVMGQGASLPDRCVKCNAPAHGQRLVRKLYWHSPYLYLLILASILIYAVVAIIVRKRARVEVGICDSHRFQRRLAIALGWLFGLGGLVLFIVGLANDWNAGVLVLCLVAFIMGLVGGAAKGPVVSAKRIDPQFVWIKGVCPSYLESLPEWKEGG